MTALQPLCAVCGDAVPGIGGESRAVRCASCFDSYLRTIDEGFLEHFAEFGARARQVVAETCLRALVLANIGDRKLLGVTIYEQFVGAASELIALSAALRSRDASPISRAFLEFRTDGESARRFFRDAAMMSGVEVLAGLGLPPPETVFPHLPPKVAKDVTRALRQALDDLARLGEFRDLGERSLLLSADHFQGHAAIAGRTEFLAGRELTATQVASVALDLRRGRFDIAALRVDEDRLQHVIDGIDVFTRLTRNLIYAYVNVGRREKGEGRRAEG